MKRALVIGNTAAGLQDAESDKRNRKINSEGGMIENIKMIIAVAVIGLLCGLIHILGTGDKPSQL